LILGYRKPEAENPSGRPTDPVQGRPLIAKSGLVIVKDEVMRTARPVRWTSYANERGTAWLSHLSQKATFTSSCRKSLFAHGVGVAANRVRKAERRICHPRACMHIMHRGSGVLILTPSCSIMPATRSLAEPVIEDWRA
jgi:hypothetical protein